MIQIEVTEEEYYRLHELLLVGMINKDDLDEGYSHAFDEFVDYSPVGDRIGDQPESIQKVWREFMGSTTSNGAQLED